MKASRRSVFVFEVGGRFVWIILALKAAGLGGFLYTHLLLCCLCYAIYLRTLISGYLIEGD